MFVSKIPAGEKLTARAALRRATSAKHRQMHRLEPFTQIAAGTLPICLYQELLRSLFQFHSAVGQAARHGGWSLLSSSPQRLELLRSDLAFLGDARPLPSGDFETGPREAVLGALYAAEGSMLGGRVIARQLESAFGSKPDGRRFFVGDECDAANWSRLVSELESTCDSPGSLSVATTGAIRTFEWFERCVSQTSVGDIAPLDLRSDG